MDASKCVLENGGEGSVVCWALITVLLFMSVCRHVICRWSEAIW